MARDFLASPVSTVSSESAFSAAGRLIGKNRTSLSPKSLETLICSKDWFIGFNNDDDEGEAMEGYSACELQEDISRYCLSPHNILCAEAERLVWLAWYGI